MNQQKFKVSFKLFGKAFKMNVKASNHSEAVKKLKSWLWSQVSGLDISKEDETLDYIRKTLNI